MHIEQTFMIEIFAGGAVLCSVAKAHGLVNSIAVDKVKKQSARATIFQLNLLLQEDRDLLESWLSSPLLVWIHLSPVCGTASRARDIQRGFNDPQPLRNDEHPEGLPHLSQQDKERVRLANRIFEYSCWIFLLASRRGVLATLENPKNSYFWLTVWFRNVLKEINVYHADFQMCMLGGERDTWTRLVATFKVIEQLNITCDRQHVHTPWGQTRENQGKLLWAKSLESQYPRKMCVAVVMVILQQLSLQGLQWRAQELQEIAHHPLMVAKQAQIAVGQQPKTSKLPPLVPEFSKIVVCRVPKPSYIPCSLLTKLSAPLTVAIDDAQTTTLPAYSRLLRCTELPADKVGVRHGQVESDERNAKKLKLDLACSTFSEMQYEAAFGLPWTMEQFIAKACRAGHPRQFCNQVPEELDAALSQHVLWSDLQMSKYRIDWCRQWLKRAAELEPAELEDRLKRPLHVQEATRGKRLLLTEEILQSLNYNDLAALKVLREWSTLAGDIEETKVFRSQFQPGSTTLDSLVKGAKQKNEMILAMTRSSGDAATDKQMLQETEEEIARGWASGPFELNSLPEGSLVSRRFALQQGEKVRMIDDYSISGINSSATAHNKIDLHMVDTFCAVVKRYFEQCAQHGSSSAILGKTYDLKSAYRQVPICSSHLPFAFFSVWNWKIEKPEIYQLRTLPFGAVHSVYNFLRLARMIYFMATKGLFLLTTNFYDDFILATRPSLEESAKNAMELVFLLTGWEYAKEGKKKTDFGQICKALGVEFNFSKSESGIAHVYNTASRVAELQSMLQQVAKRKTLRKQEALTFRGKLGFADSFVHGRLGAVVLKQLTEHAYSPHVQVDSSLLDSLKFMEQRLKNGRPFEISCEPTLNWYLYTDASFETSSRTGGIGAVLVNEHGCVVAWFGFQLDTSTCEKFGALIKENVIYELEMAAGAFAFLFWGPLVRGGMQVWFGDNDSVRFAFIKARAEGEVAKKIMNIHLENESSLRLMAWYARVPTESNLSDHPSRASGHPLLLEKLDVTSDAEEMWQKFVQRIA